MQADAEITDGESGGSASDAEAGDTGAAAAEASIEDLEAAVAESRAAAGDDAQAEQLNRELNESLARFDGALLGERQRQQAQTEERGSSSTRNEDLAVLDESGAAGEGEGNGEAEASYGPPMPAGGAESAAGGGGMSPGGADSAREGEFEQTASAGTVPPDIPDGSDDDVVARQIREAAMKEKDPELREKLWDEYRKYVNSTKRKP